MKNAKALILTFFLVFISACGTSAHYDTAEITDTKVITKKIPANLVEPTVPNKFMPKEEYMALQPHEREQTLTVYILDLYETIKKGNLKLEKIKALTEQY